MVSNSSDLKITNRIVLCQKCGLGYLNPRLDTCSLKKIYNDWYKYKIPLAKSSYNFEYFKKYEFEHYHLKFIHLHYQKRGRLLDVGTGTGLFVSLACDQQWVAEGIDWCNAAVQTARIAGRHTVYCGSLADRLKDTTRFDVITMFDYLEHSEHPLLDIASAEKLLHPGGLLAIRVPNRRGLQARILGLKWNGIISLHLNYFESESIKRLMEANNLEIVMQYKGNFSTLSSFLKRKILWILHKLSHRQPRQFKFPNQEKLCEAAQVRPWQFLWGTCQEVIEHVGGWGKMGSQLFVIARKRHA